MKRRTCSKSWKRSSHCASCDKSNARTSFICTRTAQHNTRSLVGALADRPTDYAMLCSKCSPPLDCAARRGAALESRSRAVRSTLCARGAFSGALLRHDAQMQLRRASGAAAVSLEADAAGTRSAHSPRRLRLPSTSALNSTHLNSVISTQLGAASALRHNLRAVRRSSRLDSSVVSLQPSDPFVLLCGARRTRQKPE